MKMRIALCMFTALAVATVAYAEDPPVFISTWGTGGTGPGQFQTPLGMAVDSDGNAFVVDSGNNRVQKFSNGGNYLGEASPGLNSPRGIAIDATGAVFVGDGGSSLIRVFGNSLMLVRQWSGPAGGALALDPTGTYLYEALLDTVYTFNTLNGAIVNRWRFDPVGRSTSSSISVGSSGAIYIGVHDIVRKFSPTGALLTEWGGSGTGPGQFDGAGGTGTDSQEDVFVTDGNSRVQKFSSSGMFLSLFGSRGTGDGQFSTFPVSVATDSQGNIFVLDAVFNRVEKFGYTATPTQRHSIGGLFKLYR